MPIFSDNKKVKLLIGDRKIKKGVFANKKVYSSGNICTYYVDSGQVYTEELDEGASCLAPTSFIPEKTGYTFTGWSLESSGGNVLTDLVMGDAPITLYAQFIATTLSVNLSTDSEYVIRDWGSNILSAFAWINRSGYNDRSTHDYTGYLTIKLGAYKKAIVVLKADYSNATAWYDTNPCRHGQAWINGTSVIASNTQNNRDSSPRTYTYTSNTTIPLRARAWINGNNGGLYTYVGASVTVQSVTLSM